MPIEITTATAEQQTAIRNAILAASQASLATGLDEKADAEHQHPTGDIQGLVEAIADAIGARLTGTGPISVEYDDTADTLTVSTTATQNAADADLRDRTTHTGSQPIATITGLQGALDAKAPLDSASLTGSPTAPTAPQGDDSTAIATTEFVQAEKRQIATQAEAEAGTDSEKAMTPERTAQAIAAQASGGGGGNGGSYSPTAQELPMPIGTTLEWDPAEDGRYAWVELTKDVTLKITSSPIPTGPMELFVVQDGEGDHVLTLPSDANSEGSLQTMPSSADLIRFTFLGGNPPILSATIHNLAETYEPIRKAPITGYPAPEQTLDGGAPGQWSINGVEVEGETAQKFRVPWGDAIPGDTIEQNGNSVTVLNDYTPERWPYWESIFAQQNAAPISTAVNSSLGGVYLSGSDKFLGGLLGYDGKIYCCADGESTTMVIDPRTDTAVRTKLGTDWGAGDTEFWGAARGGDGRIFMPPATGPATMIIDPKQGTAILDNWGAIYSDNNVDGAVGHYSGKVYVSHETDGFIEIDPFNETAVNKSRGGSENYGGSPAPNGKIYLIPYDGGDVVELDPATDSDRTISSTGRYMGGCLAPNGKIYCPPRDDEVLVIDPKEARAYQIGVVGGVSGSYCGATLGYDGRIYCAPNSASSILIIDPETNEAFEDSLGASVSGTYRGAVRAFDGRIFMIPDSARNVIIIGEKQPETPVNREIALSVYLNHC